MLVLKQLHPLLDIVPHLFPFVLREGKRLEHVLTPQRSVSTRETRANEYAHLQIAQAIQYKYSPIPSRTQPCLFFGSSSTHGDSRIHHDIQDASESRTCVSGIR